METLDPNRKFWNPEIEEMSRDQIREMQWQKLVEQLEYDYENSLYYREIFDEARIKPQDIHSWEDFEQALKIQMEHGKDVSEEDLHGLTKEISDKMHYDLRV